VFCRYCKPRQEPTFIGHCQDEPIGVKLILSVYRIEEYIPDSLYDSYESIRDFAIDWLIRLGVIGKGGKVVKSGVADGPRE
jgi:hypothetical protein